MTLDGGWALIISGVLCVVLGGVGTLIWRHVDSAQDTATEAMHHAHKIETEFLRYKAHVAENYAPRPSMERMEESIYAVISRLETKIDRIIDHHN